MPRRQYSDLDIVNAVRGGVWETEDGEIPKGTRSRWKREGGEWDAERAQAVQEGREPVALTRVARALVAADEALQEARQLPAPAGGSEVGTPVNARGEIVAALRAQLAGAAGAADKLLVAIEAGLDHYIERAGEMGDEQFLKGLNMLLTRYQRITNPEGGAGAQSTNPFLQIVNQIQNAP